MRYLVPATGLILTLAVALVLADAAPEPILIDDAGSSYSSAKSSLATQLALAEARAEGRERDRGESASRMLDQYIQKNFRRDGGQLRPQSKAFAREFLQKAEAYQQQFRGFNEATKKLIASLAPAPAPGAALIEFLSKPGGAEVLFASANAPVRVSASDPIAQELSEFFAPGENGGLVIPAEKREAARARLDQSRQLLDAIDKAYARVQRTADRMTDRDQDTQRFKRMLNDRTYAAASALKELGEMRSPDYDRIPQRVSHGLKDFLREGDRNSLSLPRGVTRDALLGAVDQMDTLSARVEAIRPSVQRIVDQLPDTDELHRGWKRILMSEATLINLAIKTAGQDTGSGSVSASDFASTPLGRYIVPAGRDGVRINKFRANMARAELDDLIAAHEVYLSLAPKFDELSRASSDPSIARAMESPVVRAVLATAYAREAQLNTSQTTADLSSDRASKIASVIGSMEQPLRVDLKSGAFSREPIDLFRSSIFFNPRTAHSRQLYNTAFPDHRAARLFGLFEWNALQSTDMRSYLARLEQERPRVAELARTHDAFVIMINFMPSWLSRSRDDSPLDGHYLAKHGSQPRDWDEWERIVLETVRFMEQFKGVELYFEIWNEPDGYWAEDLDVFLELYARTATAIKKASPSSKVGGCGINHWKGKIRKSPNRGPVMLELIRYAGKRNLPMDFVSWHHFTRPASQITEARKAYESELRDAGFTRMPEFIISEWNVAEKGTSFESVSYAETMVEFVDADIDMQTYASWEEFNANEPDPDSFGPWGLITQKGEKKPPYYLHEWFDSLSRNSEGIAIFRSEDTRMKCIVSRKTNGEYEAIAWEVGLYGPKMEAAIKALAEAGIRNDDLKPYGDLDAVEVAVRENKPASRGQAKAFEIAHRAYENAPQEHNYILLDLPGVRRIDLLDARSVYNGLGSPVIAASGDRIAIRAERNEVVWFRFRAD